MISVMLFSAIFHSNILSLLAEDNLPQALAITVELFQHYEVSISIAMLTTELATLVMPLIRGGAPFTSNCEICSLLFQRGKGH